MYSAMELKDLENIIADSSIQSSALTSCSNTPRYFDCHDTVPHDRKLALWVSASFSDIRPITSPCLSSPGRNYSPTHPFVVPKCLLVHAQIRRGPEHGPVCIR